MRVPSPAPGIVLGWLLAFGALAGTIPTHDLKLQLEADGRLSGSDHITRPWGGERELRIRLAGSLRLRPLPAGIEVDRLGGEPGGSRVVYRLRSQQERDGVTLQYNGKIETDGGDGLAWDGGDGWYPDTGDALLRFRLRVTPPSGWDVVSQGERVDGADGVEWAETHPQDTIYLIAGPFIRTTRDGPTARAEAYLRSDDPALARRYLEVTEHYLSAYSELIGPYPYAKFAVVENTAETGFGMPSFTLLGPRVIRLPFILHSSYPHEILHNWWGNGVYVDYTGGNWSEGLTAYLADHWIKEQAGKGAEYRRDALKRYADYVAVEADFPVARFVSRHSDATQAVGYSKTLMVFHMLRRKIGDTAFVEGMRRFYRDQRFRFAAVDDLRSAFEQAAGQDLGGFFQQWIDRDGAPDLILEDLQVASAQQGYVLSGSIVQRQRQAPYRLELPLAVTLRDEPIADLRRIELSARRTPFRLRFEQRPVRLDMDPRFDVFRRLATTELPVTLGRLFGARENLLLLPSLADARTLAAYTRLARSWQARYAGMRIASDADLERLPPTAAVWILGKENRHFAEFQRNVDNQAAKMTDSAIQLGLKSATLQSNSLSAAIPAPDGGTWGTVIGSSPQAIDALARKLPHYGKYSLLVFEGESARNRHKWEWSVTDSPNTRRLDGYNEAMGRLPAEVALQAGDKVERHSQKPQRNARF